MRTVLHRVLHDVAAAAAFDAPDIDRLVTLGRIRAHRVAATGCALLLVVAATVLAMQDDDPEVRAPPDSPAPDVRPPDDEGAPTAG
jgi:hypothetical protein